MKKIFLLLTFIHFALFAAFSQEELVSAKEMLEKLSEKFKSNVKGYQAKIKWIQSDQEQSGELYFKNPQKMRIDFIEPANQVICTNGYELTVYMPSLNIILHQNILEKEKTKNKKGETEVIVPPVMINPVGYDKFLKDYSIEYHESRELKDYEDGAKVYTLKLIRWRSSQNGFNVVFLTVQNDGIIRKVEGITAAYKKITLIIDDVVIKNDISDLKFEYEPPAHANTVEDFISSSEGGA